MAGGAQSRFSPKIAHLRSTSGREWPRKAWKLGTSSGKAMEGLVLMDRMGLGPIKPARLEHSVLRGKKKRKEKKRRKKTSSSTGLGGMFQKMDQQAEPAVRSQGQQKQHRQGKGGSQRRPEKGLRLAEKLILRLVISAGCVFGLVTCWRFEGTWLCDLDGGIDLVIWGRRRGGAVWYKRLGGPLHC